MLETRCQSSLDSGLACAGKGACVKYMPPGAGLFGKYSRPKPDGSTCQ